jgi:hypothetical protein
MARGPGKNDMIVWKGKWQRKKEEKSGLSRQAFTNEQDGRTRAKLRLPTPLSSVSRAQLLRRNGAVGSYLMAHISAVPCFQTRSELAVAVAMGMSICEVVECV